VTPAEPAPSAADLLHLHAQKLTVYLEEFLARHAGAPPRLAEAIAYSLLAGGKRLRPALVMECCSACGGRPDSRSALSAAAAVELVHTFSLVHDDLPAMDNDDLRRGRPTNHKVFGEAMAILAGDAMVALAFEAIAADASPSVAPALARTLAVATGPMGMIGGQVLDMEGENRALSRLELEHLHRLKTGALLTASCRMGAIAAGAPPPALAAMSEYGRHLGLAFQIVDDVLDVTASAQQMGKATGKDAGRGKNTYPALLGLEASRAAAEERLADALAALAPLGKSAAGLEQLAKFVVQRER